MTYSKKLDADVEAVPVIEATDPLLECNRKRKSVDRRRAVFKQVI